MTDKPAIREQLEGWLSHLSPTDRARLCYWLVSEVWAIHRGLTPGPRDTNRARKQAALKVAIAREWGTPRMHGAHELADQQLARHAKSKARMSELGAAGLYIPQVRKGYIVAMHAVWQLPDGSWLTPDTTKPPCCFEQLHASLSLPRAPIAVDPAYLLTDF